MHFCNKITSQNQTPTRSVLASKTNFATEPPWTLYGLDLEAALAVYKDGHRNASAGELLAAVSTDWFYRIPAIRLAEAHLSHRQGSTYLYEFGWCPPTFDGRIGACHFSEVAFAFNTIQNPLMTRMLGPNPPQAVADAMHAAWIAFATTGDLGPDWPRYNLKDRSTMHFGTVCELREDPRAAERQIWDGRR